MGRPVTYPDRLSSGTDETKGEVRVLKTLRVAAIVTAAATALTACSGGSSSTAVRPASAAVTTQPTASGTGVPPATGSSASGVTTAAAPSAATTGAPTTAAPTSAAVPTTTAAATTKPSSKPTKALSPFEADPGVHAMRLWAAQVARTINSGHEVDAALTALMSPQLAAEISKVDSGEQGHLYPGPLPFTPVKVVVVSSTARYLPICIVSDGFSVNPKTHKPYGTRKVLPITGRALIYQGRWVVSAFDPATFSCKGVKIAEPTW